MLAKKTNTSDTAYESVISKDAAEDQKYIMVQVALRLFHEQGFGKVKFAQIAKESGLSNKEAKCYFSSIEEICHRVIDAHIENQKVKFEGIDENSNPRQRLSLYLDTLIEDSDSLIAYGCPMTDLYFDMKREEKALADHAAEILQQRLSWIREQFVLITRVQDILDLPERMDSAIHGIRILAQYTGNVRLIRNQVNQLKSWIRSM